MRDITCVQQANAILGEGPVWDRRLGVLYWVDIMRPAVFRFEPGVGQTGYWPMPTMVGCVALTSLPQRLVVADEQGLGFLELTTGELRRIGGQEIELVGARFNDGKVDRAGRFWAGTMDSKVSRPLGNLYRLDADHSVRRMASGFICSNGLGWSPDNRTMYFTDSLVRTIWAYEFDPDSGELGARRDFARLPDGAGVFDGLTVDSLGYVWVAIWDGWRVMRYAPDGAVDDEIRVPVQRPTSCVFGGADLKTLYITSACAELGSKDLRRGPLAGALFAIECDVAGISESVFAG